MKKVFVIILASLFFFGSAWAGPKKKKGAAKKPVVEVVEPSAEELYFEEMLPNTAKVMFIDSVVVNKADFLFSIPFSPDMGRMVESQGSVGYINEFDNTEVFAHGDSIKGRKLYLAHKYGKEWNDAHQLSELNADFSWVDYPFLMANGITLYFSAKGGDESFGRMDIYKTNYDSEESKFYEPTNLGLPFNSLANDYFVAISDMDNLGWLVSDRNQPVGKVCIYTFEPTENRQTFSEDIDEKKLKGFATISSIKDTWKFGNRNAALKRVEDMRKRIMRKADNSGIFFVVNDRTVYTSATEFRSPDGKEVFAEIEAMKKQYAQNIRILDATRKTYSETAKEKRHALHQQIQQLEHEQASLIQKIATAEKALRNAENN